MSNEILLPEYHEAQGRPATQVAKFAPRRELVIESLIQYCFELARREPLSPVDQGYTKENLALIRHARISISPLAVQQQA